MQRRLVPSLLAAVLALPALSCGAEQAEPIAGSEQTDQAAQQREPSRTGPGIPPEGHRWVGRDGVVVAVPDWWTAGDTQCLLPVEDTVYTETGAVTDCATPFDPDLPAEVSSLALVDAGSAHGERLLGRLSPDGRVGGEQVLAGQECGWIAERTCRTVLAVPSRGLVLALHVAEQGDVDPDLLRDSLTLLPDGWTTVPLSLPDGRTPGWGADAATVAAYVDRLRSAGLVARVEAVDPAGDGARAGGVVSTRAGGLVDVAPVPGTPVEDDAEVVLTVLAPDQRHPDGAARDGAARDGAGR